MRRNPASELRRSVLSPILKGLYRWSPCRRISVGAARLLEGGEIYSSTLRDILERYHGIRVGAYSYGECMIPGRMPAGVVVGRYVSMASDVRVFLRNHPLDRLSLHPFFFNRHLGFVEGDTIETGSLEIGHDAWIGSHVTITPGCRRIGIGAVVGAGSVVTKDVPDFAIVAGNPARLIRFRFPSRMTEIIKASRWWERPISECAAVMDHMAVPASSNHPLLAEIASKRIPVPSWDMDSGSAHASPASGR